MQIHSTSANQEQFQRTSFAGSLRENDEPIRIMLFISLHFPLALFLHANPIFSRVHALFTMTIALVWALTDKHPYRVIYVVAYITGAELLWRGTGANIFWEMGKYATSLFLILTMIRFGSFSRSARWPVVFFILLIPSIYLLPRFDRQVIAFNLAGPFALAVASMFFSTITLTRRHLCWIFIALIAPAVSLATLTLYGIITTERIVFTGASIKATAAGIGPNQVSSILGLGALAAFFYIITENRHRFLRLFMIAIVIWLLAQTMLTFSRGGTWTTLGAIAVAGFYLLRERRARTTFMVSAGFVFLIGHVLLFPALDNFTGGLLEKRFRDFETTGRIEIIHADLSTFIRNPISGVGPGQSDKYHALIFRYAIAHTEFSRMLAEHGSFGLLALMILLWVTSKRVLSRGSPLVKAYTLSFTFWAILFMFHAATRLAAPSFLFGFASVYFSIEQSSHTKAE